jgi:hypothetical protein
VGHLGRYSHLTFDGEGRLASMSAIATWPPPPRLSPAEGVTLAGIDSLSIDDTSGGERPVHSTLLAAGIPICEPAPVFWPTFGAFTEPWLMAPTPGGSPGTISGARTAGDPRNDPSGPRRRNTNFCSVSFHLKILLL